MSDRQALLDQANRRYQARQILPHLPKVETVDQVEYPEAPPREVSNLAAVTCHYNPCGHDRLDENYHRFRAALPPDLDLWTVELAYDSEPFRLPADSRTIQIRGFRPRHLLWQKERLLNLAICRLPADYDAVAWLDRDALFLSADWPGEATAALGKYSVCQLFARWVLTDAVGRIDRTIPGYVAARKSSGGKGMPGGCWAARRDAIAPGLYDRHIVGGGDAACTRAFESPTAQSKFPLSPAWQADVGEWAQAQYERTGGSVTHLPGDVLHLYHGEEKHRNYRTRYEILRKGGYDPGRDVEVDPETGLLQWTHYAHCDKRRMIAGVAEYFESRQEG